MKRLTLKLASLAGALTPGDAKPLLLDATLVYKPEDAPQLSLPRVVPVARICCG